MPTGAEPRLAAARAVQAVLDDGQSLRQALAPAFEHLRTSRDRALARRLSAAVLRDRPALELRLAALLRQPLKRSVRRVHHLLLVALAELIERREPAPAVIHASVSACRQAGQTHLAGLVNAVLRSYLRRAAAIESDLPQDPATRHGLPEWLATAIGRDWPHASEQIFLASNQPPLLWLRTNRRRIQRRAFAAALDDLGLATFLPEPLPDAIRLDKPFAIARLPGFEEGWFAVQDGGAQWAAELLAPEPGERVLDACAAPGGKAAHLLERADVDLIALELDALRPSDWWDGTPFDRILIDAPCSATGVLRRHPDIRWLRRPEDLVALTRLQAGLLDTLWPLLKPGGILVYVTCSILACENHDQIRAFLERTHDAIQIQPRSTPERAADPGWQILPGDDGMDGFYYAVLGRLQAGRRGRLGTGAGADGGMA